MPRTAPFLVPENGKNPSLIKLVKVDHEAAAGKVGGFISDRYVRWGAKVAERGRVPISLATVFC